jgi:hypothetical protein
MISIALAMLAATLADLLTFVCAASVLPIAGEGNPVARWLWVNYGVMGVGAYKALGLFVILLALSWAAEPLRLPFAAVLIVITLLAAGTNTLAVVWSR